MYNQYAIEEKIEETFKRINEAVPKDLKLFGAITIFCLLPLFLFFLGIAIATLTGIAILLSCLAMISIAWEIIEDKVNR